MNSLHDMDLFAPRRLSCGILILNAQHELLLCHVTGQDHWDLPKGGAHADESPLQAALRETREETGWEVELTGVIGIYLYTAPSNGITYQRVCFSAKPLRQIAGSVLDHGIIGARWMTRQELAEHSERLRSPLVLRCVDDFLIGDPFPLAVIRAH